MKDKKHTQQGFLKHKMEGFQVQPPEEVWTGISGRLDNRGRRRTLIVLLSTAASLALAISLGLYLERNLKQDLLAVDAEEAVQSQSGESSQSVESAVSGQSRESGQSSQSGQSGQPSQSGQSGESGQSVESAESAESGQSGQARTEVQSPNPIPFPFRLPVDSKEQDEVSSRVEMAYSPEDRMEADSQTDHREVKDAEKLLQQALQSLPPEEPTLRKDGRRPDSRWFLGAALSPLYSFRDANAQSVASYSNQESGMISYAGGVQVGYRTTRRLALETGVYFNKMGINIGAPDIQLFAPDYDFSPMEDAYAMGKVAAVSNSVGNIISNSGEVYVNNYKLGASASNSFANNERNTSGSSGDALRQHLDYVEFPLNLRYTVLDRTFKIQLVGGVSTNVLVNNYVTQEGPDGYQEIGYLSNLNTLNYSGNAGLGLVYKFSSNFSLNMEPRFRYYLNSVNDESLPATRPYSLGIYTGLSYFF